MDWCDSVDSRRPACATPWRERSSRRDTARSVPARQRCERLFLHALPPGDRLDRHPRANPGQSLPIELQPGGHAFRQLVSGTAEPETLSAYETAQSSARSQEVAFRQPPRLSDAS